MNVFVLLNTKEDILKNIGHRAVLGHLWLPKYLFPTMEVNGARKQPVHKISSKYLPLCSAEQRNEYRFGTTWEWVNDRIFIYGWTIPLNAATQWPKYSKIQVGLAATHKWAACGLFRPSAVAPCSVLRGCTIRVLLIQPKLLPCTFSRSSVLKCE